MPNDKSQRRPASGCSLHCIETHLSPCCPGSVSWAGREGSLQNELLSLKLKSGVCLRSPINQERKGAQMKYYTSTTQFNCGIDLHARQMYACIMDRAGNKRVDTNILGNDFEYFLKLIEPYRHDLTVVAECT